MLTSDGFHLGFRLGILVAVVDVPVDGLVVGIAGGAVLGLAANVATMRFVADVDPESPNLGSWDDDAVE